MHELSTNNLYLISYFYIFVCNPAIQGVLVLYVDCGFFWFISPMNYTLKLIRIKVLLKFNYILKTSLKLSVNHLTIYIKWNFKLLWNGLWFRIFITCFNLYQIFFFFKINIFKRILLSTISRLLLDVNTFYDNVKRFLW